MSTSLVSQVRIAGQTSHQTFDVLLRTLAEPGTVRTLPRVLVDLDVPTALWVPLALADVDVPISVGDALDHPLAALVHDATGAPVVPLEHAWIAVLPEPSTDLLRRVNVGTALAPEDGARVALPVSRLDAGSDGLRLSGPGVPGERAIGVDGVSADVLAALGRASGPFPAGFDTWLCDPTGRVAAIPRSTAVHVTTEQPSTGHLEGS